MALTCGGGGGRLADKTDSQTKMRKREFVREGKREQDRKRDREGKEGRNKGALRQRQSGTACVSTRRGFSLKFPIFISATNQRTRSISA